MYVVSFLNDLYCFGDEDGFGFGSDPHYGLFVENSLKKGFSFECQTYKNDVLSQKNHFFIDKLEIWGFRPIDKNNLN